ncbi:hypothetical protein DFJ43DRAFT_1058134 [Lentinula guzmanii]|uniref:BZIP domain-containing protein n=1 Tax=Lentinula guzmanii TaxID=2804957 RepID=A0AA38JI49_9AGAR|nr:hypothetical protein DFJ43DRAFT_1058134 [Lentinula guzmanii]
MVRGRKKDMTIPVSRTIALQRDYRERKAKYVTDLEDKCKLLEEQNVRLIEEVKELRRIMGQRELVPESGMDLLNCRTEVKKEAFGDIMKTLSAAMTSIENFQHLAEGQSHLPLFNSSSSTPPDSVTSPSSLSSGVSSSSPSYSAYRVQPLNCPRSVNGTSSFSPSVDGYASNHPNATPSPSPSFSDTPGSQSNYQQTGSASDTPFTASNYWNQTSSPSINYFASAKQHLRHTQPELVPQDRMNSDLALEDAAKALSNLSSNVLSSHPPFQRTSAMYTTPVSNDSFGGYAHNMVPAGQSSRMRSNVYGCDYRMPARNSSGEPYLPTSG